ncbi:MAG: putative permease, er of the PurR regulon, partial [Pseudomonadota bacterium]
MNDINTLSAKLSPSQYTARIVAGSALLLLGIWLLHGFLIALAWAAVIAIATWPLYKKFFSYLPAKYSHALSPALFTLIVSALLIVPLAYAATQIAHEGQVILRLAADVQKNGMAVPDWVVRIPFVGAKAVEWWRANLADPAAAKELLEQIEPGKVVEWSKIFGVQLLHRSAMLGFALVTLFFLYRDGHRLAQELSHLAHRALGDAGVRYGEHTVSAVQATVNGLVLVGLGEGVLLGIAYAVCGLPHAAMLGALTGLLAMIPFAAPVIFGGAAMVLFAQGSVTAAIGLAAFGGTVLFIADHFIRPALIGGSAKLPFLWVLLGILGGLETLGLIGLFLGPAIMAALTSVWRDMVSDAPEK